MKTIQKKICMLGDYAVGKTSLVKRFVEGKFDDKYLSSVGVKISRKSIKRQEHTLNLILWDLAGGDTFTALQPSYLQGSAGALIVCDLTRRVTLDTFEKYLKNLRTVNPEAVVVLIANKSDLEETRQITDEMLAEETKKLGGEVTLLTSAKSGENVEKAFERLADLLEKKP